MFDLELAGGARCVGIRLESVDGLVAELHPDERAFATTLAPVRRRTWIGGRAALRRALDRAGMRCDVAVLPGERGEPRLPSGLRASISHKDTIAVAMVASGDGPDLGIDIETDAAPKRDIARWVLTPTELAAIESLRSRERARAVLVRFSAKEAIYKALNLRLRRYIRFQDVDVVPLADGSARAVVALQEGEGTIAIDVRWRCFDGFILTAARSTSLRTGN